MRGRSKVASKRPKPSRAEFRCQRGVPYATGNTNTIDFRSVNASACASHRARSAREGWVWMSCAARSIGRVP
jgi:hypothetical protein